MDEWNATQSVDNWSDVDTATVVSIGSSCVILISGCIAVVCLILYMKKSEQQIQRQIATQSPVCVKCGQQLNQRRSIGVITDRQIGDNSALYAISGPTFPEKDPEDALLGVICGHVSDTQTTTYSTNCNDIHVSDDHLDVFSLGFQLKAVNDRRRPPQQRSSCSHSQCSHDSELIYEMSRNKLDLEAFDVYESIGSERETPTDPGIREFTESPPKPNERRQGVVQHSTDSQQQFGALPRFRSRQPMWKLSSEATTLKCLSALSGLSSGESEDDFNAIDC